MVRYLALGDSYTIGEGVEDEDPDETDDERRMRELILHGPQHVGEGVSQDFVDDVFASNDQDDIDALFR